MRPTLRLTLLTALAVTLAGGCARTRILVNEDGGVTPVDAGFDGGRRDLGPTPSDLGPTPIDLGPPRPGCTSDAECSDSIACNGVELCARGVCIAGAPPRCDDGVDCTDDSCVDLGGDRSSCVSTPTSDRCPTGQVCTVMGCAVLACTSDIACSDGFACNGEERCAAGRCAPGVPPLCDDGAVCTTDRCVEGTGCVSTPRDDDHDGAINSACGGTDCNDGDPNIRPGIGEVCDDRFDNDCSGAADCADPTCATRPPCAPPPPYDGGMPDIGVGTHEIGVAACTNGVDDDSDGRMDCDDSDCRGFGPGSECCNGIDDTPGDGDPNYDLFACRCFSDADCRGVGSIETSCWTRSYSLCGPRCNFVGGDSFCRMFFMGTLERCDIATGECLAP